MTAATDALNGKLDDLTSAVTDALAQMEGEVATIKQNAPAADDTAAVNASATRIGSLSATIRAAMVKAKGELSAAAAAAAPPAPVSASTATPVALAGVPVTPEPAPGLSTTGPAVPSVDADLTQASPNKQTSSPVPEPSGATKQVSGT